MSLPMVTKCLLAVVCVLSIAGSAAAQTGHEGHTQQPAADKPRQPVPPVTEADRRAAFPDGLDGHSTHDTRWHYFVLFDQLEWQGSGDGGATLENTNWIGGDIDRVWIRTEAASEEGRLERASVDALWGHAFSRWWDVVAGVRQDFRPGDPQTWVAAGVQGLAPYWFEVEATAYLGAGGRTQFVVETDYDLLLTNRLVLQPQIEISLAGKSDPERRLGAGLTSLETGLRLRYEIRPELAPYVGITWERTFFGTADQARREGGDVSRFGVAVGVRTWF